MEEVRKETNGNGGKKPDCRYTQEAMLKLLAVYFIQIEEGYKAM